MQDGGRGPARCLAVGYSGQNSCFLLGGTVTPFFSSGSGTCFLFFGMSSGFFSSSLGTSLLGLSSTTISSKTGCIAASGESAAAGTIVEGGMGPNGIMGGKGGTEEGTHAHIHWPGPVGIIPAAIMIGARG